VLEGELVAVIRELAGRGVGSKRIARTVGVARNTVRRYLREAIVTGMQRRPTARRLTEDGRREARALYEGPAGGNAVVCTGCCVRRIFGLVSGRWSERSPHSACAPGGRRGDGPRGKRARRAAADRFWAEARPNSRRVGPRFSAGRGPELLPSAVRQSLSQ
jgi:hypothetical protein